MIFQVLKKDMMSLNLSDLLFLSLALSVVPATSSNVNKSTSNKTCSCRQKSDCPLN